VLDAGAMGHIVVARRLVLSIFETCRFLLVSSGDNCLHLTVCNRRDKLQTNEKVLGTQGSSMQDGNECYPIWSQSTLTLLWHKSYKI